MLNELGERWQGQDPERRQGQDLDQSRQLQVVEGLDNNLLDDYASD
jgi:hypothetical protein